MFKIEAGLGIAYVGVGRLEAVLSGGEIVVMEKRWTALSKVLERDGLRSARGISLRQS